MLSSSVSRNNASLCRIPSISLRQEYLTRVPLPCRVTKLTRSISSTPDKIEQNEAKSPDVILSATPESQSPTHSSSADNVSKSDTAEEGSTQTKQPNTEKDKSEQPASLLRFTPSTRRRPLRDKEAASSRSTSRQLKRSKRSLPQSDEGQREWLSTWKDQLEVKDTVLADAGPYDLLLPRLTKQKRDQNRDVEAQVILSRTFMDADLLAWRKVTMRRMMEDYLIQILDTMAQEHSKIRIPEHLVSYVRRKATKPNTLTSTLWETYQTYCNPEASEADRQTVCKSGWVFLFNRYIKQFESLSIKARAHAEMDKEMIRQLKKDAKDLEKREEERRQQVAARLEASAQSKEEENDVKLPAEENEEDDALEEEDSRTPAQGESIEKPAEDVQMLKEKNTDLETVTEESLSDDPSREKELEKKRRRKERVKEKKRLLRETKEAEEDKTTDDKSEEILAEGEQMTPPADALNDGPEILTDIKEAPEKQETQISGMSMAEAMLASKTPKFSPQQGFSMIESGTIKSKDLEFVGIRTKGEVPQLNHDLQRVLFNPGVYYLRDPRSRVYNFNPWLSKIMPTSEFDLNALGNFVTSSKDPTLRQEARDLNKRYISSSSSMTSILSHFHFLISNWRRVSLGLLSASFQPESHNFTRLIRAPSAVFLKYKDGVYAMDADKEFDTESILSSLGRVMEKMLVLPREEYERYRKEHENPLTEEERNQDDGFRYSGAGKFLLRSQLDCRDPRLPGSGVFDLKTRAVAPVRMFTSDVEKGIGYEIRTSHGSWESFEREYYDMIRSVFLKYSLQVRLGDMDGIFVAYHNIQRLFGFQYISLPEMDSALHGTRDPAIGHQEFKLSLHLVEQILDRATARYPKQNLRIYFETRDGSMYKDKNTFMYIFVKPVADAEVTAVQEREKTMLEKRGQEIMDEVKSKGQHFRVDDEDEEEYRTESAGRSSDEAERLEAAEDMKEAEEDQKGFDDSETTVEEDDGPASKTSEAESEVDESELMILSLQIRNQVNGKPVDRPVRLKEDDDWDLDYGLFEVPEAEIKKSKYYRMLFKRCRARRRKLYTAANLKDDWNSPYFRNLSKLTERGRKFREEQNELDRNMPIKTLK